MTRHCEQREAILWFYNHNIMKDINKMKISILFLAIITLMLGACTKLQPGQIKVEGGIIQGTVTEDMAIYKGIPFATPPVGNLRWKAPQPVEKWEGIKQTTEYAPAPMQGGSPASGKSEDCLYLMFGARQKQPMKNCLCWFGFMVVDSVLVLLPILYIMAKTLPVKGLLL